MRTAPPRATLPEADGDLPSPQQTMHEIAEIGAVKTLSQHAGNVGFGLASAICMGAQVRNLAKAGAQSMKLSALTPILHLGVTAVEGYNAFKKYHEKDPVVAATHAGNAVGCFAAFLESGAAMAALGENTGLAVGMGAVGGALGLAAGTVEIRQGLKNMKAGGSPRTLIMGMLDVTSGLTSFAGAGVALSRTPGPLGPALLMAASAIDLSGIAIDYLGHKGQKADTTET